MSAALSGPAALTEKLQALKVRIAIASFAIELFMVFQ
jgi:hypothetical protein